MNLGADQETPVSELAEMIRRIVGYEGEPRWDPTKPDGQPRRRVDPSRAHKEFGFQAQVSLEVKLRRTLDWYLAHREEAEARAI